MFVCLQRYTLRVFYPLNGEVPVWVLGVGWLLPILGSSPNSAGPGGVVVGSYLEALLHKCVLQPEVVGSNPMCA